MDKIQSPKGARVRSRSRKSISHIPTSDTIGNKENLAAENADITGLAAQSRAGTKKSRSKSLGPGDLDALRNELGNGQKVGWFATTSSKIES